MIIFTFCPHVPLLCPRVGLPALSGSEDLQLENAMFYLIWFESTLAMHVGVRLPTFVSLMN